MNRAARIRSAALDGTLGRIVEIEADISNGLPNTTLVGLPDASVAQARDRCRAAVVNSGHSWPSNRLTINLAPSSLPKTGSHYDLGIALAVLAASGMINPDALVGVLAVGELALDGRLRPVAGVLPATHAGQQANCKTVIVPWANAAEAQLVVEVKVLAAKSLAHAVALLTGEDEPIDEPIVEVAPDPVFALAPPVQGDFADVIGQSEARVAMIVAAAGGHHVSLVGPPGVGKTMLAARLPSLLPDLNRQEALEVSTIHSVAGLLTSSMPLIERPPFLDPHHTASAAAIVGGGSKVIRPGAMSLAHRGVLFLDEAPEFASNVLDALRQPLESGRVVVSRAAQTVAYPARFQLILAANPCPCGSGDDCQCSVSLRRKYHHRISGPIRDRIDIHRELTKPARGSSLISSTKTSAHLAELVAQARARQAHRYQGTPWKLNAEVDASIMIRKWPLDQSVRRVLDSHIRSNSLSPRGADRVARLAWTIADLAGSGKPSVDDISTALALRKSTTLTGQIVDLVA